MAKILNLVCNSKYCTFNLSNKPEYDCLIDKTKLHILTDRADWYIHLKRSKWKNVPYIRSSWNKEDSHLHLHREVLGLGKFTHDIMADHITHKNGIDNRLSNLRVVDSSGNSRNREYQDNRKLMPSYRECNISGSMSKACNKVRYYAYLKRGGFITSSINLDKLKSKIDTYLDNKGS